MQKCTLSLVLWMDVLVAWMGGAGLPFRLKQHGQDGRVPTALAVVWKLEGARLPRLHEGTCHGCYGDKTLWAGLVAAIGELVQGSLGTSLWLAVRSLSDCAMRIVRRRWYLASLGLVSIGESVWLAYSDLLTVLFLPGVLVWLAVALWSGNETKQQETSVLGRQCLGGGGEQCVYHCEYWDTDCVDYVSRLEKYCHYSLLTSSEGAEGNVSGTRETEGLELVHLHIVARHGDRTPTYAYKISPPVQSYECGLVNGDPKWNGLSDFKTVSLRSSIRNSLIQLSSSVTVNECVYGHLTQTGYMQEYALGALMRKKYARLADADPGEMYVQSTDHSRSIHSAAAFLLGFLPNDPLIRNSTAVHISPGDWTATPPSGIERTYNLCSNYLRVWSQDLKAIGYTSEVRSKFQPLVEQFCQMFNLIGANKPIISEIMDHLLVRGCHLPYDPLPCNGRGQCVDYSFAKQLTIAADWTWGHKFPRNSSLLAMLPFLKHSIFDVMENVVQGKTPVYKVLLTFTHDDVIIKLRSILGIFTPRVGTLRITTGV